MITCNIKDTGRLGNQLFVLASMIGYAKTVGSEYGLTTPWVYSNVFSNQIPLLFTTQKFVSVMEPNFSYCEIPLWLDNIRIEGYRQSEKYFQYAQEEVFRHFTFKKRLYDSLAYTYAPILFKTKIAVHVRRGDYINLQQHHTLLPLNYYIEGMNKVEYNASCVCLVFSDDIEWCKNNFTLKNKWDWFENTIFIEKQQDFADLCLMSMCDHFIIANSSFSWWGSYLSSNKEKRVVCPGEKYSWFGPANRHLSTKDLIPEGWIKI
jgi:hypothetical protein